MLRVIKDIKSNLHALQIQLFVTIKTTVATTRLGVLWWILDPLILMLLYTFVVKIIFDRGGPKYYLFALCGIVTWQSFARSINLCTTALTRNSQLIRQSNLPMHLYVILPPIVQAFFYLIGLFIIAIWNFEVLAWFTPAVLLLLIPMILIPYTIGLFLSIITVKIPDIGKAVPYLLRFGFYMSPVLYPPERLYELPNVSSTLKALYSLNPMVHIITAVRAVLFNGEMFDVTKFLITIGATFVFMQAGLLYFQTYSKLVPKEL